MRILFIAWDGPHVNYMEGLFLPVFSGLRKHGFNFSILHFSTMNAQHISEVAAACQREMIPYRHVRILTLPFQALGKYLTLLISARNVWSMIREHGVDCVMPRSTMPARIVLNALGKTMTKIVFDADGLPIEERVDFGVIKKGGLRYNLLKRIEAKIIKRANIVLTRSNMATNLLIQQYGEENRKKFHKVVNGRDETLFRKTTPQEQDSMRKSLGIPLHAFVSVYCGSLGPQYGLNEMSWIHEEILKQNPDSYWLILTGNTDFFKNKTLPRNSIIRNVPSREVPKYLSIANLAFALRLGSESMRGVAPVKLGEYLLMGLPVLASSGIGDTEEILSGKPFCHILSDFSQLELQKALAWVESNARNVDPLKARTCGEESFGLVKAIESYKAALEELR